MSESSPIMTNTSERVIEEVVDMLRHCDRALARAMDPADRGALKDARIELVNIIDRSQYYMLTPSYTVRKREGA